MAFDSTTSQSYNSLINKLPSALKITDFWPQYIEALAEELDLEDNELIILSKLINNPSSELNDYLLYLATKYGYTPNLIIDNSIEFLQKEVLSIPYRIRHKATYKGYKFNFKQIDRIGEVYNFYYNNTKLIKAIDWTSTFIYAENYTTSGLLYKPFTYLIPDINYSTVLTADLVQLDTNHTLDEKPIWTLDNSAYSMPCKHLAIEYYTDKLITVSGDTNEYCMYNTYLEYLGIGTEYNRRSIVFPHNGTNIVMFTSSDGTYNGFNYTTTSAYSIPEIKLQTGVTLNYLSTYLSSIPTKGDIVYGTIGTGTRALPSISGNILFSGINNIYAAYSFDEDNGSTTITDHSLKGITTVLSGTTIRIDSILGRSINWNGATYGVGYNINVLSGDSSFYFWFNPSSYGTTSGYLFSISGLFSSYYNYSTQSLNVGFNGTSICSTSGIVPNMDYLVCINNNYSNLTSSLYINGTIVSSGNFSSYTSGTNSLYIGTNSTISSTYVGKMDSLLVYNKLLDSTIIEKNYLNRLGIINSVQTPMYTIPIATDEQATDSNWFAVQSSFPTNSINNEYLFTLISGTTSYSGILKYGNLIEKYLKINYYTQVGTLYYPWVATDDGNGNILGDYISGTIDYTTGTYIIYPYVTTTINSLTLSSVSISSISNRFLNYNIKPGTFYMYYNITSTSYVAIDNGNGVIVGTGISSGTIDYGTGELNVTFTQSTQSGYIVTCRYIYETVLTITSGKPYVYAEYKTNENLNITEVCFSDKYNNALLYSSFPPINSYSMYNHASFTDFVDITTIS
jgi:hypothetical protein